MSTVWRVDAHQHFWRFDPAAYGWIGDDMAVLKRDFLPAELRFELDIRHIGGSVAVQARFNRGVETLQRGGKVYEVLIHAKDLPAAIAFCGRHDLGPLVLDHLGKPDVRHESAAEWARRIAPLAAQEHVSCKLSGLITEAHWHGWDERDLLPYLDAALECFGPSRLLFGSDWPVCLLSGTYDQVCGLAGKATASLSEAERDAVWGGNACRVYGIGNL